MQPLHDTCPPQCMRQSVYSTLPSQLHFAKTSKVRSRILTMPQETRRKCRETVVILVLFWLIKHIRCKVIIQFG